MGQLLAKPEVLMAGTGLGSRDQRPPHGRCPGDLAGLPEETEKLVPPSLRRSLRATPCGELLCRSRVLGRLVLIAGLSRCLWIVGPVLPHLSGANTNFLPQGHPPGARCAAPRPRPSRFYFCPHAPPPLGPTLSTSCLHLPSSPAWGPAYAWVVAATVTLTQSPLFS